MSLRTGAVALLGAALCGWGCATAPPRPAPPSVKTVLADGWAPFDAGDPVGSRRRAVTDAQWRAAEQVNGVSVAAATLVAEAVGVRSRVLSEAGGGVVGTEVLGESREGGFLKVRVRAAVLERPPGAPAESPPLGVLVSVSAKADGPQARAWEGAAVDALRWQLLARGFSVAEPGEARARPDLVVRAEARADAVEDPRLGGFKSYVATLSVRAVRPQSGEVVWSAVREGSALDPDDAAASAQAVATAGLSAGQAAAAALSRIMWQRF